MELVYIIATLIAGLLVGGLLNEMIYRLPSGEIPFPRRCRECGKAYSLSDYLSVVAGISGRNHCDKCGALRKRREAIIELANAFLWLLSFLTFRNSTIGHLFISFAAISTYICIGFIEYDGKKLPGWIYLFLLALGILDIFCNGELEIKERIIGALLGGGFFALSYAVCYILLKKEGLGWSDVKLMAVSGFLMGWQASCMTIIFGTLVAAVILAVVSMRKGNRNKEYPFSAFISIGAIVSMMYGEAMLRAYIRLFSIF